MEIGWYSQNGETHTAGAELTATGRASTPLKPAAAEDCISAICRDNGGQRLPWRCVVGKDKGICGRSGQAQNKQER